ncbi:MAG TPA: NAD-dependent epimerase/dehydratase family protein [Candidatus Limnocylindrales bacterium]|nr:NAD-dependent epimerase/dehydratase family protein [Candidatus Limnocylindrales bacterium]
MILLTGATGFIGRHLLDRLLGEGQRVRCLVRGERTLPCETALADLITGARVDRALAGVDTVIHLAGVTKALRPAEYESGNVTAAAILASEAAGKVKRFVHVSSLAATGPATSNEPVNEDTPPHPVSIYGRSKLRGEEAVRNALPDAVIVRPPVVYGPADTDVFRLLKAVSQGLVVEISGGERWFSSIFVLDLVEGILAAATKPQAAGRTYFLANPRPNTWAQLGASAAATMGKRVRVLKVPAVLTDGIGYCGEIWSHVRRKPGIVSRDKMAEAKYANWTCDPARAAAELNFTAATPLDAGLAATLAWYREAGWLKY